MQQNMFIQKCEKCNIQYSFNMGDIKNNIIIAPDIGFTTECKTMVNLGIFSIYKKRVIVTDYEITNKEIYTICPVCNINNIMTSQHINKTAINIRTSDWQFAIA